MMLKWTLTNQKRAARKQRKNVFFLFFSDEISVMWNYLILIQFKAILSARRRSRLSGSVFSLGIVIHSVISG